MNHKNIAAMRRLELNEFGRKMGTMEIVSKRDKAKDPRRQRKTKDWRKNLEE